MVEQAGKAASAWVAPREKGEVRDSVAEPMADMVKTFSKLTEYWLSDPARALEAQTRLFAGYMDVWKRPIQRSGGEEPSERGRAGAGDKRFQDPEWGKNAFFDFLKQAYLVTSRWANDLVEHAELDEHTKPQGRLLREADRNAISPSNFILTNPELFRETVASNGENLVRGMKMLAEDIEAGKGDLKLRQADYSRFEIGRTSP
jgi:polyhydroxyalkanoate synthase